jgi:hypothetical protein
MLEFQVTLAMILELFNDVMRLAGSKIIYWGIKIIMNEH